MGVSFSSPLLSTSHPSVPFNLFHTAAISLLSSFYSYLPLPPPFSRIPLLIPSSPFFPSSIYFSVFCWTFILSSISSSSSSIKFHSSFVYFLRLLRFRLSRCHSEQPPTLQRLMPPFQNKPFVLRIITPSYDWSFSLWRVEGFTFP